MDAAKLKWPMPPKPQPQSSPAPKAEAARPTPKAEPFDPAAELLRLSRIMAIRHCVVSAMVCAAAICLIHSQLARVPWLLALGYQAGRLTSLFQSRTK
jgi:hypothetical protein